MIDGIMSLEAFQKAMEARRLEIGRHQLAYKIGARQGFSIFEDGNSCLAAYTHKSNGGAIYVLPDRLAEEFDNTDCDEIRMSDLKLPFTRGAFSTCELQKSKFLL